jgi:hypothetical protein
MKYIRLFVVFSLILGACATEDEKMEKYMLGNWKSIYVKLELPTYQAKDTLVEYDIDFENPHDPRAQRQGRSYVTYNSNGTFKSWTEKNRRTFGQVTEGKWKVTKDSLFYFFQQGAGKKEVSVSFGLKQIEDGFAITGLQDRDNDGAVDDTFYLETVRMPETEK